MTTRQVQQKRYAHAAELMANIRAAAHQLASDRPSEAVIGNMICRVLRLVREAYAQFDSNYNSSVYVI